jgi:hypothetical protein
MNTNTAFTIEDQAATHHISAEMQGKSPQDVLIEFKSGGIKAETAIIALTKMGIFSGDALAETLLTLLDGIDVQDIRAAVLKYPHGFRERVLLRAGQLVGEGLVDEADERHLLSLFRGDG